MDCENRLNNVEDCDDSIISDSDADRTKSAIEMINKCSTAMSLDAHFSEIMLSYLEQDKSLSFAEDALLSLASSDMADGIFFCCVLKVHLSSPFFVARYFEYGAFDNFYKEKFHSDAKAFLNIETLIPYAVYTKQDVKEEKLRTETKYISRKTKNESEPKYSAFRRAIFDRKKGVNKSLEYIMNSFKDNDLSCMFLICYCLHKNQDWQERTDSSGNYKQRFFIITEEETKKFWEDKFDAHRCSHLSNGSTETVLNQVPTSFPILCLEDEFFFLSLLPNFHKWNWFSENASSKLKFEQRFSNSCRRFPGSPRNRIIQACCYRDNAYNIVKSCLHNIYGYDTAIPYATSKKKRRVEMKDNVCADICSDEFDITENNLSDCSDEYVNDSCDFAISVDKNNSSEYVESVNVGDEEVVSSIINDPIDVNNVNCGSEEVILGGIDDSSNDNEVNVGSKEVHDGDNDSIDDNEAVHIVEQNETIESDVDSKSEDQIILRPCSPRKLTMFQYYCSELFRSGKVIWRVLDNSRQVVVMNNYDSETGNFLCGEYVHVIGEMLNHVLILKCSCSIFSIPKSGIIDSTINSCCHTRLLKDLFSFALNGSSISPISPIPFWFNSAVVSEGITLANTPVVELPIKSSSIRKFSVNSDGNVSFVNIFQVSKTMRRVVQCQSSRCKMEMGNSTRAISSLDDSQSICIHLLKFKDFIKNDESLFINYDDELENFVNDESLPDEKWQDVFDPLNGKWKFGSNSPSTQRVDSDSLSPHLIACVKSRYEINVFCEEEVSFSPSLPTEQCSCKAGWTSSEHPDGILCFIEKSLLYLHHGVKTCSIYYRRCIGGDCKIYWTGEEECIFRLSKATCAGYEIGWEFVDYVMNGKNTFAGFTNCYSERYLRAGSKNKFMSNRLFIDWFFAWASHMDLEFRQQCPSCGGNSDIVACDGTKLGIGFKNTFVSPIETPTEDNILKTTMRRHDRCFIFNPSKGDKICHQYAQARKSLYHIAKGIRQDDIDFLSNEENVNQIVNLINFIPNMALPAYEKLISNEISKEEREKYAEVFIMLSYDTSLDAVLPLCITEHVKDFCEGKVSVFDFQYTLMHFNSEFSELVGVTNKQNGFVPPDVTQLLHYCASFVIKIHEVDIMPAPAVPIDGTYNPPKYGRAYYFTEHGCQVRFVRRFSIDKKSPENKIFDDAPAHMCNKNFHQIGKKGTSFLFLWFCPKHGHCLGYHVIPGSEGRKDAAASLYTHMPDAPSVLFYDFACSLSEYNQNRESGYFRNTRYFHDVFHGYSHKCGKVFRSDRLQGFEGLNTSICEQFNSFIQNIKTSCKLMSQTHFTFYLQFFIYFWNAKKEQSFQKKRVIASNTDD